MEGRYILMNVKISNGIVRKRQKVVIYGPEGIGKSTLAAQFPNPLLSTQREAREISTSIALRISQHRGQC